MPCDLLIRNAKIIDGSGKPAFDGSIAVTGGKIVGIGEDAGPAGRVIDAKGAVVAPGFVDIHTHYDAQVFWDPTFSSSSWHGVTTVLMGNCGVGVAPCPPGHEKILAWDLVNVEALPYDVLLNGLPWDWESYGDYLDSIDRRGVALNVAGMVPLSPLRYFVMGPEASERSGTPEEIEKMAALFRTAMENGAFGMSISMGPRHLGYQGRALASRMTSNGELTALCHVMRDLDAGVIEIALLRKQGQMDEDELERLRVLARESRRPITWASIVDMPRIDPSENRAVHDRVQQMAREEGATIRTQVTPRPIKQYFDQHSMSLSGELPSWKAVLNRSPEERMEIFRSKEFRDAYKADLDQKNGVFFNGEWDQVRIARVEKPGNQGLMNKTLAEIAAEQGKHPVDAFLDLAVDEELSLGITIALINANKDRVAELLRYDNAIIGLSDAGAHVTQHCEAGLPSYLIQEWVRNRGLFTLEEAVKRLTSEPAEFLGLRSKGRIEAGKDADLVIFDPDTIGTKPQQWTSDLPGGSERLVEPSQGVLHTIVAGEIVVSDGVYQGGTPGRVLRAVSDGRG
jgi:N-acyl-D-aspartate/D-glutamate deacylase